MFAQQWNNRKRERDGDDDEYNNTASGFGEHRTKRRIASLPDRTSPKLNCHVTPPTFTFGTNYSHQPAPPTITPADSESEDTPSNTEPKSFFSPYSSPLDHTVVGSAPPSPYLEGLNSSQSTQISDVPMYSDDFEMTDSVHLSPPPFQNQPSPSLSGRIPTPIHSSFSKASIHHCDVDFADDEALVDRFLRGRRMPTPISEGEPSPSVILEGLGDVQMEVDPSSQEKETPTKKGHQRSKHSLRQWTGFGEANGNGVMKRSFSMGYRADCEKCRMKVPGHFSHIITY